MMASKGGPQPLTWKQLKAQRNKKQVRKTNSSAADTRGGESSGPD